MKNKIALLIISIVLFSSDTINAFQKTEYRTVDYTINPIHLNDRVNLKIKVEFEGNQTGESIVSLPVDRYGTQNIYQSISEFSVENGRVSSVFEKPELRKIFYEPNGKLILNYTISFDPKMSSTSSFSPIIESKIFHFFGSQWKLSFLEEDSTVFNYQIKFIDIPDNWGTYSNLAKNSDGIYQSVSMQNEFSPFIAGGKYDHTQIRIDKNPVDVIISYHFKEDSLLEDLVKLMTFQREFFNFESNNHYLVSITYRKNIFAGTALKNSFISLLNSITENNRHRSLVLLAHETFHNWIPQAAEIYVDENEVGSEYKTEFFNEGITTYAPKIMLYDQGLISKEKVIELLNASLLEYARNPFRDISFKKMQRDILESEFGNFHERVAYFKGDLIGFKWDNIIRRNTNDKKNLLFFLKDVIQKAEEEGGKVEWEEFFEIANTFGIDAKSDWEKYIRDGKKLIIEDVGWIGEGYEVVRSVGYFYELGFDSGRSRRQKIIYGIIEGSNAFNSGIRNGMQITSLTSQRDINEEVVLVAQVNGVQKTFRYFPSREIEYQKMVAK